MRAKFVITKTRGGFRWRLEVRGQPLAVSSRLYATETRCRQAIASLAGHAASTRVEVA